MGFDTANIIVGAAQIFVAPPNVAIPSVENATTSYATTLENNAEWRNIGYTSNGLEIQFAPEFGEVQVDQMLDVAKLFKSGMTVTMNTSMSEATLENLAFAIAAPAAAYSTTGGDGIWDKDATQDPTLTWGATDDVLDLTAGELGECPVEMKLIAVGPGPGECGVGQKIERIYTAFRVLSIESVTASQKRDEASTFDVSFRLLPDSNSRYGQIVDRKWGT